MAENQRRTLQDAHTQLYVAQLGALVTDSGAPLGDEHLPYLRALRAKLFAWADDILAEIDRIESTKEPCGDCGLTGTHHCDAWCDVPNCDTSGAVSSCHQATGR
jgi:hypothetical protein